MIVAFTGNRVKIPATIWPSSYPLKQACAALFLFDDEQLYSKKEVVTGAIHPANSCNGSAQSASARPSGN